MDPLHRHEAIEPGTGRTCMVLERDREDFERRGYVIVGGASEGSGVETDAVVGSGDSAPPASRKPKTARKKRNA